MLPDSLVQQASLQLTQRLLLELPRVAKARPEEILALHVRNERDPTASLIPLRDNPVHGRGGFSAGIAFSDVTTAGQYWAGFSAVSVSDLPSWDLNELLGDNFFVELPGLQQGPQIWPPLSDFEKQLRIQL